MSFLTSAIGPNGTTGVPKDAVVSLPGGKAISLAELAKFREAAGPVEEDAHKFLGNPEILLKNPKPGAHYGWPLRTNATAGKLRQGAYRKVTPDELKGDTPYEISTQEGVGGGGQVEWHNHVLVEIEPEFYAKHFVAPMWRGTEQLARLKERLTAKAEQMGLNITPEVTATPVTSY